MPNDPIDAVRDAIARYDRGLVTRVELLDELWEIADTQRENAEAHDMVGVVDRYGMERGLRLIVSEGRES